MVHRKGEDMQEHDKADAIPASPVFATYLEASQEAARRRRGGGVSDGVVTRVVRSPYGGYVIRSWPLELLAEPELRRAFLGRPVYADT